MFLQRLPEFVEVKKRMDVLTSVEICRLQESKPCVRSLITETLEVGGCVVALF